MRAQSCNTDFVPYRKDFCISINSSYPSLVPLLSCESKKGDGERIGLLKGTPNAIMSVWEPKEGGRIKSLK